MAVFPIYLCGNLEYYRNLFQSDEVVFEIHEHFPKQTHRNRMEILGPNGRQKLILPTVKRNSRRAMKDVEISYAENWQKNHWKSLEAAYRRSAYFEFYEDRIKPFYTEQYATLVEFNLAYHQKILDLLKMDQSFSLSTEYQKEVETDYRNRAFELDQEEEYLQVFSDRFPFTSNLSILDALFNLGPEASRLLTS